MLLLDYLPLKNVIKFYQYCTTSLSVAATCRLHTVITALHSNAKVCSRFGKLNY